ncbi:Protein maelstrom-like protein [Frankliniella fusca]|uniref:Protein maelstrom-like protein n=1 Tax=Frankliniella fusca TaxID=407009 RepID=A0AAE1HH66_9NEOP|nr:Protein maelstrom-like protein [Frankliniella fusca]
MPPKKKKQPRNAFYFFMMDWKKEKEEQGQRFSNLQEVTQLCSDDWKHLPEHNLLIYKQMEKEAKGRDKDDKANKYDSLGKPFSQIENERREQELASQKMYSDIDDMLMTLASNVDYISNHCFFLIHSNVYCYWGQQKRYIPAEVAISKFNLKNGVIDTYHVFPAPNTDNGEIPLGYRYEVNQNTDTVHSIPDPREFNLVEKDWEKIRQDVYEFLGVKGETDFPPLFTMKGDDANTNCYETSCRSFLDFVSIFSDEEFRLYDLSLFFFKLYEVCSNLACKLFDDEEEAFVVQGVAHQQLTRDYYNHEQGITCKFHTDTDYYFNCSKSFVQRWVFLICEFCCKALRLKMIPGKHCISTAKISYTDDQQTRRPPQSQQTSNTVRMSNLSLEDETAPAGAWGGRMQSEVVRVRENQRQSQPKEVLVIDRSIIPDPAQIRVLQTGQAPNVVSEIKQEPVRLPTTMGRGEMMARGLGHHPAGVNPSFSSEDFPALGSSRPGRLDKPLTTGWGRGFLKQ